MADSFEWSSVTPTSEHHYTAAHEAFNTGSSFPQIAETLQRMGLTKDAAQTVMAELARKRAYALLSAGKKESEIIQTLFQRGLGGRIADQVVREAASSRGRAMATAGDGIWKLRALVLGMVFVSVGFLLMWSGSLFGITVPTVVFTTILVAGFLMLAYGGVYLFLG